MSEEQKKEPAKQEAPAAQPETSAPDLTVQDLQMLRNVIDVASSRGTFKASEMAAVGAVYNKLDTFLKAVSQQNNQ